jgi:hypothetical protein
MAPEIWMVGLLPFWRPVTVVQILSYQNVIGWIIIMIMERGIHGKLTLSMSSV